MFHIVQSFTEFGLPLTARLRFIYLNCTFGLCYKRSQAHFSFSKFSLSSVAPICGENATMVLCRKFSFVLAVILLPSAAWGGFVDMDTPLDKRTTKSLVDNTVYHLVGFKVVPLGKCNDCFRAYFTT